MSLMFRTVRLDELTLSRFVIVFLLLAVVLVFLKGIQNRYFHTLSQFPGPFWGSVTTLYLAYTIKKVPTVGYELHQRYGPIVRLSPNLLSFSDAELLPKIYHSHADKPPFYGSWLFGTTNAMFLTLDHKEHARKKRVIGPCFSMKALKGFENKFSERLEELCGVINERSVRTGQPLDFSEHLRWFLSDTYHQLAYGQHRGCVKHGRDIDGNIMAIQNLYKRAAVAAVIPWPLQALLRNKLIRQNIWSHTSTFKALEKLYVQFRASLSHLREQPQTSRPATLFAPLTYPDARAIYDMTIDDLAAEYITFTAATLDGVAAFISPFVDNLIQHPNALSRVQREIDLAQANGNLSSPVVTYEETSRLPFFMACIMETLRRDAPAQTILPRIISKGGLWYHGVYIPEGTEMGASPYIIHRDVHIFGDDPFAFRPERWLEDPARSALMEKYGMWWGYGGRECIGKNYAMMEMQKLCLELCRRFDMRSAGALRDGMGGGPDGEGGRYRHDRWAVGMFWGQGIYFSDRKCREIELL